MNKIILYTDAGCAKGRGGFAFLLQFTENQQKQIIGYGNTTTENPIYMELLAIKKALEFLYCQKLFEYEIDLCCDVLSIIHFFNNRAYVNYLGVENKKRFRNFKKYYLELLHEIICLIESVKISNIRFVKVKSKKDEFNKLVHTYATFARNSNTVAEECLYILDMKEIVYEGIMNI